MGFPDLLSLVKQREGKLRVAVVLPDYREIYKALQIADTLCFSFTLIGPDETMKRHLKNFDLKHCKTLHAGGDQEAAQLAVDMADRQEIDLLMKGSIKTAVLMKAVLEDRDGLRGASFLSHVAVFECPDGRFIGVTDGGLNILPTIDQKVKIIKNAATLFHQLGVPRPNIALLSGVEVLNPAIPSTVDAVKITEMAAEGTFPDAVVEGPLAFDLAYNRAASRAKRYTGQIQGNADIFVAPEIVSGNVLGKSLNHAAGFPSGGVVMGARIPIVLLSRSDRAAEKLNSLILAGVLV